MSSLQASTANLAASLRLRAGGGLAASGTPRQPLARAAPAQRPVVTICGLRLPDGLTPTVDDGEEAQACANIHDAPIFSWQDCVSTGSAPPLVPVLQRHHTWSQHGPHESYCGVLAWRRSWARRLAICCCSWTWPPSTSEAPHCTRSATPHTGASPVISGRARRLCGSPHGESYHCTR